jgi:thiol-disulfide isomerase/thioredoxin
MNVLDRLILALAIVAVGIAAYRLAVWLQLARRARRHMGHPGFRRGRPAILYFTTPGCEPCENVQAPELARLQALREGWLQVLEVNAFENPTLADHWGVLSVPTTFLIDSQGRPRRVNNGVARMERLMRQFEEIGEAVPRAQPVEGRVVD